MSKLVSTLYSTQHCKTKLQQGAAAFS